MSVELPEAAAGTASAQSPAEHELATLLVDSLGIEHAQPAEIDPQAALFGEGLGLDSIDALELSLAIGKQYGVQLKSGNDDNKRIFSSLRSLSAYIEQHRAP